MICCYLLNSDEMINLKQVIIGYHLLSVYDICDRLFGMSIKLLIFEDLILILVESVFPRRVQHELRMSMTCQEPTSKEDKSSDESRAAAMNHLTTVSSLLDVIEQLSMSHHTFNTSPVLTHTPRSRAGSSHSGDEFVF